MFAKTLTMVGLAATASAHIVMTNPVPLAPGGTLDNSPLFADGSNFPCKGPVTGGGDTENVYEQGSVQQLAFKGTAVHGGGSCQVSVTSDLNPTSDSVWKVIKSIEGGCPAQDTEGNLGSDANAEVPYTYDFTIPSELASGEYVFAWSWFNKVGNREMYMNCAAVSVTGSGGSDGFLDTLPDMFTANIGTGCGTVDSADVEFPNPGQDVERLNGATSAFAAPTGSCGGSGGSPPTNPDPSPEPTTPPTPTEAPTPPESPEPTPTSIPGGIFITVTSSAVTAPTEAPETPETPETPEPVPEPEVPTPTPEPEVPVPEVPSEGAVAPGTACSEEGTWNCVGGTSFQRCASGAWSAVLDLAAGMTCENGQSSQLRVSSLNGKRSMRRSLRVKA